MKKLYLQPQATVTIVTLQNLIADSPTDSSVNVSTGDGNAEGYGDGSGDDDGWGARPQWFVDPGF